jgi:death on curing protein
MENRCNICGNIEKRSILYLANSTYVYCYGDDITLFTLATAYGYGFVKNHCFIDGNKRIALIAVYTFLSINGIELTASEIDAASFFFELAASQENQEQGMSRLVDWLQINSEPIVN